MFDHVHQDVQLMVRMMDNTFDVMDVKVFGRTKRRKLNDHNVLTIIVVCTNMLTFNLTCEETTTDIVDYTVKVFSNCCNVELQNSFEGDEGINTDYLSRFVCGAIECVDYTLSSSYFKMFNLQIENNFNQKVNSLLSRIEKEL